MSIVADQATVELWVARNEWVQFAEGENRWTGVPGMDPDEVPPADWTEAPPCETCWSLGDVMKNPEDLYYSDELGAFTVDGDVKTTTCPGCGGSGKQREAVQVPFMPAMCETCEEDRTTDYHDKHDHAQYHGGKDGLVTVAWATQTWGPNQLDDRLVAAGDKLYVVSGDPENNGLTEVPPDIDPHTLIGQWARGGIIS